MHNEVDQRQMRIAAEKQAQDRANREGEACFVYRNFRTWYVRTAAEGEPVGAVREFTAFPETPQAVRS
jgi:hypothetical protein